MIVVIIVASIIVVALVTYFIFPPVQVCGLSMYPTYDNAEIVIGRRIYFSLEVGDVVVFKNPYALEDRIITIKRIKEIRKDMIFVEGDNKEGSYDSRMYGFVPKSCVIAKVINARPEKGM